MEGVLIDLWRGGVAGVALAVVFALLVACGQRAVVPQDSEMRQFTDDLGRTVAVPGKVERVVSLAPNLTEIVFAVGAGDKLVGVTTFCDFPTEAKAIRKVGDTQKPNIETLLSLKPQVVLVSTASQLEAFAKVLEGQNIAVFVAGPNSVEDIFRSIATIGDVVDKSEQAAALVESLKKRTAAVEASVLGVPRPSVFVQIDKGSLYTIGNHSYITDLVSRAGGNSATAGLATAYPKISKESALAMNPDVIIVSESDGNREPNEAFRNSPAVRNGRVYLINADLLSRPGPRVVDALEQMAAKLKESPK